MTEWAVVNAIVVLVGLFFTVGKPILGFNKTVTEILGELKNQKEQIDENEDTIEKHETKLQDHEIRIHDLEQDSKK